MKHRMVNNGFGANAKVYLNNEGILNQAFADASLDFLGLEGFDYEVNPNSVSVGIEPSYQYDDLKILTLSKNKEDSTLLTGRAWGPYGSGVASRVKRRGDYKRKSKFTKFVDLWHPILFPEN